MAGRPPKNKVAEPKKVEAAPELKVEPETLIEEAPKVDEVEGIKPPEPEPEPEKTEEKPGDKIMEKYLELCVIESDINELLPFIYEIALDCETCVEFGVRRPTSTYAFLAAKPKRLISYDIGRYEEEVSEVERLCEDEGQNFQFVLADVLQIEIEECDCCLFDTYHTYTQLSKELQLHAPKIKKYMMFHDTISFRYNGQQWTPGVADFMNCGRGIYPAIEDFLKANPQWELYREYDFNNGMVILKNILNEKPFHND